MVLHILVKEIVCPSFDPTEFRLIETYSKLSGRPFFLEIESGSSTMAAFSVCDYSVCSIVGASSCLLVRVPILPSVI